MSETVQGNLMDQTPRQSQFCCIDTLSFVLCGSKCQRRVRRRLQRRPGPEPLQPVPLKLIASGSLWLLHVCATNTSAKVHEKGYGRNESSWVIRHFRSRIDHGTGWKLLFISRVKLLLRLGGGVEWQSRQFLLSRLMRFAIYDHSPGISTVILHSAERCSQM